MSFDDLAKLYQTQISLSEWFENIHHKDAALFREEDNWKRERMAHVAKHIPFPFDVPTSFPAVEITDQGPEFLSFLHARGHETCALRLIPTSSHLPKFRMRGMTVRDVVSEWLPKQDIDPAYYQADFIPHPSDHLWSTIFVINVHGIFGEIIRGGHNQLTQGFYNEGTPIRFQYDFQTLTTDPHIEEPRMHLFEIFNTLRVSEEKTRTALAADVLAEFANDYLLGYFETVCSTDFGLWFIDYNRVLGNMYQEYYPNVVVASRPKMLVGATGSPGNAQGRVCIVFPNDISSAQFKDKDILVAPMTSPEYLPLMRRAAAVITDHGGMLSHAAIVCRELGIPCVVGVINATTSLHNGDMIDVDAVFGTIKKL